MASIPLSDDYPVRRLPAVTYTLIAANVALFLLSPLSAVAFWYGGETPERWCALEGLLLQWGLIPAELLGGSDIAAWTSCPESAPAQYAGATLVSHVFLHASALHLTGNMVFLFVFGPCVEDRLGRMRFLIFYLACGIAGGVAHALSGPDSITPLVGASGAISGVLGAYLIVQRRSQILTLLLGLLPIRLPGWVVVATYFVLQYLLYLNPTDAGTTQVAYGVHVYGFLAGVLGGLLIHRLRWRAGGRVQSH